MALSDDANYAALGHKDTTITLHYFGNNFSSTENILSGHSDSVYALVLRTNFVISASADCTMRVWDLKNKSLKRVLRVHDSEVRHLALHCDDKTLVSAALDLKSKKKFTSYLFCCFKMYGKILETSS